MIRSCVILLISEMNIILVLLPSGGLATASKSILFNDQVLHALRTSKQKENEIRLSVKEICYYLNVQMCVALVCSVYHDNLIMIPHLLTCGSIL